MKSRLIVLIAGYLFGELAAFGIAPFQSGPKARDSRPPTPSISVGSLQQTTTGNCNIVIGTSTGTVNVPKQFTCNGIPPKVMAILNGELAKRELDVQQARQEAERWRELYLSLQDRLARVGLKTEIGRRIDQLTADGKLDEASRLYDELLDADREREIRQFAEDYLQAGIVAELRSDWTKAFSYSEKAYRLNPEVALAALQYARGLLRNERQAEAVTVIDDALARFRPLAAKDVAVYGPDLTLILQMRLALDQSDDDGSDFRKHTLEQTDLQINLVKAQPGYEPITLMMAELNREALLAVFDATSSNDEEQDRRHLQNVIGIWDKVVSTYTPKIKQSAAYEEFVALGLLGRATLAIHAEEYDQAASAARQLIGLLKSASERKSSPEETKERGLEIVDFHPLTVRAMANAVIARVETINKRIKEAEDAVREARRLGEQFAARDKKRAAETLAAVYDLSGRFYEEQERWQDSLEWYRKALAAYKDAYQANPPRPIIESGTPSSLADGLVGTYINLSAIIQRTGGSASEACPLLVEAWRLKEFSLNARLIVQNAAADARQSGFCEWEQLAEVPLTGLEELNASSTASEIVTLVTTARARSGENPGTAEEELQNAIEQARQLKVKNKPQGSAALLRSLLALGEFYSAQKQLEKSRSAYTEALELAKYVDETGDSADGLISLGLMFGLEEAAQVYVHLFDIMKELNEPPEKACGLLREAWNSRRYFEEGVIRAAKGARETGFCSEGQLTPIPLG